MAPLLIAFFILGPWTVTPKQGMVSALKALMSKAN
jgi:hypothetical protein